MSDMYVMKRDGSRENIKFDSITSRLEKLMDGLNREYVDPVKITQKVVEGVYLDRKHFWIPMESLWSAL